MRAHERSARASSSRVLSKLCACTITCFITLPVEILPRSNFGHSRKKNPARQFAHTISVHYWILVHACVYRLWLVCGSSSHVTKVISCISNRVWFSVIFEYRDRHTKLKIFASFEYNNACTFLFTFFSTGAPPTAPSELPNSCTPNKCLNGATCVEGKNTFYCVCTENTSGRLCEKKTTPTTGMTLLF